MKSSRFGQKLESEQSKKDLYVKFKKFIAMVTFECDLLSRKQRNDAKNFNRRIKHFTDGKPFLDIRFW